MMSHVPGLGEPDQDSAAEECGENVNTPAKLWSTYAEIVRSFSLFCVSSHGHQNLQDRVQTDLNIPGSRDSETEIPQLQLH